MPRQGVPYPSREICSLKCQIDALQRQINELMKSINGVQGDGQGNVSLISGDPAVVINSDAVQNQIEIALDTSQLPAAAVSSVNGQTGAVDLDGADIPLNPGQSTPTVQNAVAANAGNISQLQADLNQEILDRGNADSALQSNINALQASIPGEAAQAVANDPTVQGLVTADAQNVKLGGAQNITGVKTVPTEATGSATQQIANGAKVKNELDAYAPMVRTTGNQTIEGFKSILAYTGRLKNNGIIGGTDRIELFRFAGVNGQDNRLLIQIGDYLTVKYGTIPIEPSGSTILLKNVVAATTVMGSNVFTVGASYAADGKIIISTSVSSNASIWCKILTAQTGSRFPIPVSNFDFTHQGEPVTDTPIITVTI